MHADYRFKRLLRGIRLHVNIVILFAKNTLSFSESTFMTLSSSFSKTRIETRTDTMVSESGNLKTEEGLKQDSVLFANH